MRIRLCTFDVSDESRRGVGFLLGLGRPANRAEVRDWITGQVVLELESAATEDSDEDADDE